VMIFEYASLIETLLLICKILCTVVPILISVAYFTLVERKVLAAFQRRRGPNVIGVYGLLQPLADGFKLLIKETIIPSSANLGLFIFSPIFTFAISLIGWGVIPFSYHSVIADLNLATLYLITVSSLGVYGIILAGWASNSKYAFLGALRSAAQMISYEVSIGFILLTIILFCGTFTIQGITCYQQTVWLIIPLFPLFLIFFASSLAETNRHPFDLPEAEAELVSGYNVEYSAMGFALFSLAEYTNILMMCTLNSILFFGGANVIQFSFIVIPGSFAFSIKITLFVILFIWMRAALPRYRYDQLMTLGWQLFLPFSLSYFITIFFWLLLTTGQPW